MQPTLKYGAIHSLLAALYIGLVATVMSNGNRLFGEKDTPLTAVGVLLLFVLSAAVMGVLVFGRPVMWYLDGKKQEAMRLLGATVGCLAVITVAVFIFLAYR